MTILVIEDDRDLSDATAELLHADGHDVRIEPSAKGALTALAASQPDVILTDYTLPDMAGDELLARLRTDWKDIPVVVLTGRALDRRDVTVLRKPVPFEDLLVALRRAVLNRR